MENKQCYCNACGRQLKYQNGILQEDVLSVKKEWGYFSNKDMDIHEFVICEDCYDKLVSGFVKDVNKVEQMSSLI